MEITAGVPVDCRRLVLILPAVHSLPIYPHVVVSTKMTFDTAAVSYNEVILGGPTVLRKLSCVPHLRIIPQVLWRWRTVEIS
jgi:hypothetical protein